MATLKTIVESIAFDFDEQFNHTFKESIKTDVINYRALLIRQDLERNNLSYTDYLQSYCVQLELVDKSECPCLAVGEYVLKSKQKIAKPIRLKTNGRSNFKFVGSITRSKAFTFATAHEINYLDALPFQDNVIYYTFINEYFYILNNIKPCKILLEYIPADPTLINSCDDDLLPEDKEFPLPEDMISSIKKMIKRDYDRKITDGEEVRINKDLDDTE